MPPALGSLAQLSLTSYVPEGAESLSSGFAPLPQPHRLYNRRFDLPGLLSELVQAGRRRREGLLVCQVALTFLKTSHKAHDLDVTLRREVAAVPDLVMSEVSWQSWDWKPGPWLAPWTPHGKYWPSPEKGLGSSQAATRRGCGIHGPRCWGWGGRGAQGGRSGGSPVGGARQREHPTEAGWT